jgi:hypothetical protein
MFIEPCARSMGVTCLSLLGGAFNGVDFDVALATLARRPDKEGYDGWRMTVCTGGHASVDSQCSWHPSVRNC